MNEDYISNVLIPCMINIHEAQSTIHAQLKKQQQQQQQHYQQTSWTWVGKG